MFLEGKRKFRLMPRKKWKDCMLVGICKHTINATQTHTHYTHTYTHTHTHTHSNAQTTQLHIKIHQHEQISHYCKKTHRLEQKSTFLLKIFFYWIKGRALYVAKLKFIMYTKNHSWSIKNILFVSISSVLKKITQPFTKNFCGLLVNNKK